MDEAKIFKYEIDVLKKHISDKKKLSNEAFDESN